MQYFLTVREREEMGAEKVTSNCCLNFPNLGGKFGWLELDPKLGEPNHLMCAPPAWGHLYIYDEIDSLSTEYDRGIGQGASLR